MNVDNIFGLLVDFLFSMRPQLGGIRPKPHDLVVLFCPGEGESPLEFHLRYLQDGI